MDNLALWVALRDKVIQHMFDRNAETFFYLSTENAREMKTVYSHYGNIRAMIDDLDYRVGMAESGHTSGAVLFSTGGQA